MQKNPYVGSGITIPDLQRCFKYAFKNNDVRETLLQMPLLNNLDQLKNKPLCCGTRPNVAPKASQYTMPLFFFSLDFSEAVSNIFNLFIKREGKGQHRREIIL
jgi:hypothetical protein